MRRWIYLLAIAGLLLSGSAAGSKAQPSAPRLILFEEEKVEPAMEMQYERGVSNLAAAIRQGKVSSEWSWEAANRHGAYYYVWPLKSLDVLDDQSENAQQRQKLLWQGISPETYQKWAAIYHPAVRSTRTYVMARQDDLCYYPEHPGVKAPKFVFIDIHRVKADRIEDYQSAIRRFVAAVRKVDYPISWTAYRGLIGETRLFIYFSPLDTQSQFYEQHPFPVTLQKALGKEGYDQLEADLRKCMVSYEYFDAFLRPEMCYPGHLDRNASNFMRGVMY